VDNGYGGTRSRYPWLMKITRRKLAAALLAPAATITTEAQTAPTDELEAARAQVKANAEAIGRVEIPMSTEPAFRFQA